ncbi:MAG: GNAT family N-acetyltransferase [Rhodobacteraceae bacterium]|nr:GNAT family N-acetyltransferase [Paracoccaceae bacterium]MAY46451.1 GNAT family N-acetyltransferase [Paracoccaceae bacterium]
MLDAPFFLRPSTARDLAAVDALLSRSYPKLLKSDYPPSVLVTALPLISRANPALLSCGTYYLAETLEGAVLGAGGWTRDRRQDGLGHIRHVVTDDRALRRGVGRAILTLVFDEARSAGCRHLECWSTRTAEPFYAAMGFAARGPMEVPLAPGISFPAIRMTRVL